MANPFYIEGEQRGEKVQDLFSRVAPRYDLINDLQSFGLHRRWKQMLVNLAQVKPNDAALDICCGTGDIAFALARAGAHVTAVDFSEPMLNVAKARARRDGFPRVDFQRGDAQQLSFSAGAFDIVTVGYGLRNLPNWKAGLAEMHRVARAGARLLVLEFGKPDNAAWRTLYFAYLRFAVPVLGKIFCGDSTTHSYILESLKHYPAQRGVADAMREMGCRDVRIVNLVGGAMSIHCGIKM
ncbi:MAG TPA: bifunctional demethylmenaquinone methyltransferase/2-methoxy-6-polyprenyl-1,4-benzoquinol methylase UbiE [Verrucomicrobiae bacterium]|jgi:demethylmenaquinone methyltransferase/2-methoxy-6-polyprenyl-1,4-benzoquinol methylase